MHYQVRAQRQGLLIHRGGKGVVHRQQGAMGMRPLGQGGDVEHLQGRIAGGLEEQEPGAVVEQAVEITQLMPQQEMGGNAQLRQLLADELQGTAVGVADAHDALPAVGQEERGLRGHTRGEGQGRLRPLQGGELGLERLQGRIQAVAGIEAARRATLDHIQDGRGGREGEGRRVIDRRVRAPVGVLEFTGMNAACGEPALVGLGHLISPVCASGSV